MINSSNLTESDGKLFRRLALLTILIIYLLVLAGGIVRGTGSGMGCPDWPKCFGQWIPPTDVSQLPVDYQDVYGAKLKGEVEFNAVKTWIEYLNRLLGVLSGLFVFATLVASFSYWRKDKVVVWGSFATFILLGANAWLGSRVVATELAHYTITLHLLLAILVVLNLLFVYVRATVNDWHSSINLKERKGINALLLVTMVLTLGQVLLGTQVRDALNEVIKLLGYDQRDYWVEGLDWRFYVHRSFSLIILSLHILLAVRLLKSQRSPSLKKAGVALSFLVALEIITGAVMGYFAVPAIAQPVHLFLAVIIVGLQFVVWLIFNPQLSLPANKAKRMSLQEA